MADKLTSDPKIPLKTRGGKSLDVDAIQNEKIQQVIKGVVVNPPPPPRFVGLSDQAKRKPQIR